MNCMNSRRLLGGLLVLGLCAAADAGAVLAQQASPAAAQRVIRVVGVGEVNVTPDVAHLDLAVETLAPTARAAGEQNAAAMDRVIRALTGAGVARTDLGTRGYQLFPEYAPPEPMPPGREMVQREPRIVGYRARNTLTVRVTDLARVGPVIDTALGAGANRMDGLRFALRDAEAAQNQAIRQATERARRTAETMAAAAGVALGEVVEISTAADVVRPFPQMERGMMDMRAMAVATPVEPGEQTVTAQVVMVFGIR
jgi:uncharacterized protein